VKLIFIFKVYVNNKNKSIFKLIYSSFFVTPPAMPVWRAGKKEAKKVLGWQIRLVSLAKVVLLALGSVATPNPMVGYVYDRVIKFVKYLIKIKTGSVFK